MVLITIVNGVYKPTYNWRAPPCRLPKVCSAPAHDDPRIVVRNIFEMGAMRFQWKRSKKVSKISEVFARELKPIWNTSQKLILLRLYVSYVSLSFHQTRPYCFFCLEFIFHWQRFSSFLAASLALRPLFLGFALEQDCSWFNPNCGWLFLPFFCSFSENIPSWWVKVICSLWSSIPAKQTLSFSWLVYFTFDSKNLKY